MRRLLSFTTSLALVIFPSSFMPHAYADTQEGRLKDRIPKELLDEDAGFFTFTIENDNFGGNTDENYTSGVRLTYFDYSADPPWFADIPVGSRQQNGFSSPGEVRDFLVKFSNHKTGDDNLLASLMAEFGLLYRGM